MEDDGRRMILPAAWCDFSRRRVRLVRSTHLEDDIEVYVQSPVSTIVTGPWRVRKAERLLAPSAGHYVMRYDLKVAAIGDLLHTWRDGDETFRCFLESPRPSDGTPVDVISATGLAAWLGKHLANVAPIAIRELDESCPDWRSRLSDCMCELESEVGRQLATARLQRLDEAIQQVVDWDSEVWKSVMCRPPLVEMFERKVGESVKLAVAEFECTRLEEQVRIDREQQAAGVELARLRDEITTEEARWLAAAEATEEFETRVTAAAKLLDEATSRVVVEYHAFQALLGRPSAQPNEAGAAHWDESGSETEPAMGAAIPNTTEFVNLRLHSSLAAWLPAAPSRGWARLFHGAALACRGVQVPSSHWVRAYADAIGGTASLDVVAVSPVWLSGEDAWAVIGPLWEQALATPGRLRLMVLQDVNRGLFQTWARPWLNALAGLTDALIVGGRRVRWPANLRLFATLATDEATLPIPDEALADWALIAPDPPATPVSSPPLADGHVPFEAWQEWTMASDDRVIGPRAGREVKVLTRVLENLEFSDPERRARKIRLRSDT